MKKLLILLLMISTSCTHEVTLMSYNIRNCIGMDGKCDIKRTASVMTNADFIAIQEVDSVTGRSGGKYILGELATYTGMYPTYAPAIEYDGGKYGIGLLSKEKPIGWKSYVLPGREEQRVLLVAEFDRLYVLTAHFSLTEEDRIVSAEKVIDIIKQLDKPAIFAGDLNALPESEEIRMLYKHLTPICAGEKTWQADSPTQAIDYVFGKDVSPVESKVLEEKTASDHRPVWIKAITI